MSSPESPTKSARVSIPLTTWQFAEDPEPAAAAGPPASAAWRDVEVPHVFRQSGLPDNAAGWYRRDVTRTEADRDLRMYLHLEGAASVKDVYVNGRHVGRHRGAFSASAFDLTDALRRQANTLDVRVSNRDEEAADCFARSTLYYVNGGMFRKAWLVRTAAVHIYPDMGSRGVYLTPGQITETRAELGIRTVVRNTLGSAADVVVRHVVTDPNNRSCATIEAKQTVPAQATVTIGAAGVIDRPMLWDIGTPNLYTVHTEISVGGTTADVADEHTGFRTIQFRDNRFHLNGRVVQFRGVNKHAQTERDWIAISDQELRREWLSMADLGCNMVRLAHYPHSRLEYDMADERGIVVWAENGYAGQLWPDPGNDEKTITPDGERLTREMVRQNWNHPCILFWSAGNETMLDVASHYAQVIRQEGDPTRLVAYAATGDQRPEGCDVVAYNTYDGWYTGGPYTDFTRSPHNDMVTETGSGDWVTHHVPYGTIQFTVDRFEPEEYAETFTEYRLQTVCRHDVEGHPMFLWWNFREFYNLKFKRNRNTKGLLTLAGMQKDTYFLFQAFLNPARPVVHLCGRHHFLRGFSLDNGIKAYSNADELQLTVNGVPRDRTKNGAYQIPDAGMTLSDGRRVRVSGTRVDNVFYWKTPLEPGRNVIEVNDGRGHSDRMIVYQAPVGTAEPGALVQDLTSTNPRNPAVFIDRPVESQGPVYTEVDGSADNTFDIVPKEAQGASWIATRRLSDPGHRTDLSFRIREGSQSATVFVLLSTGVHPAITLKQPDTSTARAAEGLRASLGEAGFRLMTDKAVWRDHDLNLANAELWGRGYRPGEVFRLPGHTLDYVVIVRGEPGR